MKSSCKHTLFIFIIFSLICIPALARQELSLNGQWEFKFTNNKEYTPNGEWKKIDLPNHVTQRNEQYAWFKRSFNIPSSMSGEKIFLKFTGVKYVCEVYVNGASAGGHYGGWEPFELEVTDKCRFDGENQLIVRSQDVRGIIGKNVSNGSGRIVERAKDSIMAPMGSYPEEYGIWQDISLESRKDVYIDDVFVKTSVRNKTIEVSYTIVNLSGKKRNVRLESRVYDGDNLVNDAVNETLELLPGEHKNLDIVKGWIAPELWWPYAPKLYYLNSHLIEDNSQIDKISTRFGFREFWTEGIYFFLNGSKIKLLATAGHPVYGWSKEDAKKVFSDIRSANCVAMRLHANIWPETWYEAADEFGMLLIQESALWCFAEEYALSKTKFWDNAKDHFRGIVRRDKNHPSIIMYSIENEILHVGKAKVPGTESRLADLGRFVKSIDPTRPIMYDGDSDPGGVADVENLHYPHEFPDWYPWPNTTYWVDEKTNVGGYPYKEWQWGRKKPLYMGEFLWTSFQTPDPYTMFIGDEAYEDYNRAKFRSKAIAWAMQIEAFRAAEVSGMCPWTLLESDKFPNEQFDAVKKAYEPNAAFIKEYDSRFYSQDNVKRTIYLYNDTLKPAELTLIWELKDSDKTSDSGKQDFKLGSAERIITEININIPQVSQRTPLSLILKVENSGKTAFQDKKQYWAFPKESIKLPENAKIAAYGNVPLENSKYKALKSLQDITPDAKLLIIGPHILDSMKIENEYPAVGDESTLKTKLAKFVNNGGTILVMQQLSYPEGLFPANLTDNRSTVAFIRAQDSEMLKDINEDDLKMWCGDNIVSEKNVAKPTRGRFRAILDSGGKDGLTYLPLVEIFSGKGRYILCQLSIVREYEEPIARILLENIINYALKPSETTVKTAIVQGKMSIKSDIEYVGGICNDLTGQLSQKNLKEYGIIIVDAGSPELPANIQKLREFARDGGKVLLHGLTPDYLDKLNELFPEKISLSQSTSVPVNIFQQDTVISGMTNQDLYWLGEREPSLLWLFTTPLSQEIIGYAVTKSLPEPEKCQTIEAEKMNVESGHPFMQDEWAFLYDGAALSTKLSFPRSSDYVFAIRASGTPYHKSYPEVTIFSDGIRKASINLDKPDWKIYTVLVYIEAGEHNISLVFTNDAYDPITKEDRNLSLDKLIYAEVDSSGIKSLLSPAALVKIPIGKGFYLIDQINWQGKVASNDKAARYLTNLLVNLGVPFEEETGFLSISGAKMNPAKDLQLYSVSNQIAHLFMNGYIYSDVKFASEGEYTFKIRARGTEADGEYPNVRLMIDTNTIGDQKLQSSGWETLTFKTHVPTGFHRVSLVFTNDYWEPPKDRNLDIEWIKMK